MFNNLPDITVNSIDLGNLIIERFCPGTPSLTYAGKTYNTIQIGSQCWLKENLNAGTIITGEQEPTDNNIIEKYCWDNIETNCEIYGGLYTWDEAMQYSYGNNNRGICPPGWHIPSENEILILGSIVDGNSNSLKAEGQGSVFGIGTNISGFSALLTGYRHYLGSYLNKSYFYMWTTTISGLETHKWALFFRSSTNAIDYFGVYKNNGLSIRCIKDE